MYSPRKNKTKLEEYNYGKYPSVTMPVPLLNHNNSSSVHSVASLDESSSTTDSGFNSVVAAQALVPSPNSAFSPRYPSFTMQNSLTDTMPLSPDVDTPPQSSRASVSSELTSVEPTTDGESSFLSQKPADFDRASIYSEPLIRRKPKLSENDSETESLIYTRGRQRYRRDPNHSTLLTQVTSDQDNRSRSRGRYTTRAEQRRMADRKTMFEQFIAQAESRDVQARREQEVLDKFSKNRTRSASLNRAPNNSAANKDYPVSTGLKRSNSTNSRSASTTSYGLRRSNSVQDMISKAEKRDRHARVEQARLEGLIPPRKYLGRKDSVKTRSQKPASSIIQDFENKAETDNPPLTGRMKNSDTVSQRGPTKTHRKFSSFLTTSRLARPGGYHRRYENDTALDGNHGHSARSSTWNGSDIRHLRTSPLNSDFVTDKTRYKYASYQRNGKQISILTYSYLVYCT